MKMKLGVLTLLVIGCLVPGLSSSAFAYDLGPPNTTAFTDNVSVMLQTPEDDVSVVVFSKIQKMKFVDDIVIASVTTKDDVIGYSTSTAIMMATAEEVQSVQKLPITSQVMGVVNTESALGESCGYEKKPTLLVSTYTSDLNASSFMGLMSMSKYIGE